MNRMASPCRPVHSKYHALLSSARKHEHFSLKIILPMAGAAMGGGLDRDLVDSQSDVSRTPVKPCRTKLSAPKAIVVSPPPTVIVRSATEWTPSPASDWKSRMSGAFW
jgi:hypothetical protein